MKNINLLYKSFTAFIIALAMVSCEIDSFSEESQFEFGDIVAPSNLQMSAEVVGGGTGDGSGQVNFTASATGAVNYKFVFDGKETISPDGKMTYNFAKVGTHDYTVSVIAMGMGGTQTSLSQTVTVLSLYNPPAELVSILSDKPLRVLAEEGAHFGVGPLDATSGVWWPLTHMTKKHLECMMIDILLVNTITVEHLLMILVLMEKFLEKLLLYKAGGVIKVLLLTLVVMNMRIIH